MEKMVFLRANRFEDFIYNICLVQVRPQSLTYVKSMELRHHMLV